MMDKFSWRMDELERKVGNESHNVGGPPNQVASTSATSSSSNVFRNEEQDVCIASRTKEKATQAQRPNMGQPQIVGKMSMKWWPCLTIPTTRDHLC
jgi:hypothetical protein